MKTVLKCLAIAVFALQATGGSWYMHVAACHAPQQCPPGQSHKDDEHALAGTADEHSADPGKGGLPHHDSKNCPTCQLLLTLVATTPIPPSLPAITQATHMQPILSDRPIGDTFLATLDARGPPAEAM